MTPVKIRKTAMFVFYGTESERNLSLFFLHPEAWGLSFYLCLQTLKRRRFMRKSSIMLLAGALALAGTAAYAASSDVHHMKVRLADGTIANIEYTGDVAPKISVVNRPLSLADFAPRIGFMSPGFTSVGMAPGFQNIDAMIDAQMRMMQQQMAQVNAMMAMPMMNANAPINAAFGKMSPGAHFCAQSMSITTDAKGNQHVTRKVAGDCGGGANAAVAHEAPRAPAHLGKDNSI